MTGDVTFSWTAAGIDPGATASFVWIGHGSTMPVVTSTVIQCAGSSSMASFTIPRSIIRNHDLMTPTNGIDQIAPVITFRVVDDGFETIDGVRVRTSKSAGFVVRELGL